MNGKLESFREKRLQHSLHLYCRSHGTIGRCFDVYSLAQNRAAVVYELKRMKSVCFLDNRPDTHRRNRQPARGWKGLELRLWPPVSGFAQSHRGDIELGCLGKQQD